MVPCVYGAGQFRCIPRLCLGGAQLAQSRWVKFSYMGDIHSTIPVSTLFELCLFLMHTFISAFAKSTILVSCFFLVSWDGCGHRNLSFFIEEKQACFLLHLRSFGLWSKGVCQI